MPQSQQGTLPSRSPQMIRALNEASFHARGLVPIGHPTRDAPAEPPRPLDTYLRGQVRGPNRGAGAPHRGSLLSSSSWEQDRPPTAQPRSPPLTPDIANPIEGQRWDGTTEVQTEQRLISSARPGVLLPSSPGGCGCCQGGAPVILHRALPLPGGSTMPIFWGGRPEHEHPTAALPDSRARLFRSRGTAPFIETLPR